MKAEFLPQSFLNKVADPAEKKRLGYVDPVARKAKDDRKSERELHDQVAALLRLRGVRFVCHSRMDRKTTNRVGTPDFIFAYRGVPCAIELKRPGEQPTPEQLDCHLDMDWDGWKILTADHLEEVRDFLDRRDLTRTSPQI